MKPEVWLAFFAASWAISLSPGAGAVAAMSSGLAHGFRRGYWTTIGLVLGILTQIAVVGVGLGAVVAASATAFAIVKWSGVAYLVWLGVQAWRSRGAAGGAQGDAGAGGDGGRRGRLVARGWLINATNPKGTVFLLAVVPQFLDLARPLAPQYLAIAATLAFTDLVVMAGYTALAARVLRALREPRRLRLVERAFGAMFVLAGLGLAMFRRAP